MVLSFLKTIYTKINNYFTFKSSDKNNTLEKKKNIKSIDNDKDEYGYFCQECETMESYNKYLNVLKELKQSENSNKFIEDWKKRKPKKCKKSMIKKCSECNISLCPECSIKALKYGRYYRVLDNYLMCDNCCWNSIT